MGFSFLVQSLQLFKDFYIYLHLYQHPDQMPPSRKMPVFQPEHLQLVLPRSNKPARKRPVPRYSGDFMEAVFQLNESGDWIHSVPPGTDSWVEFLAFSGRVPAGYGEFPEGFRRKFMEYCFRNHR